MNQNTNIRWYTVGILLLTVVAISAGMYFSHTPTNTPAPATTHQPADTAPLTANEYQLSPTEQATTIPHYPTNTIQESAVTIPAHQNTQPTTTPKNSTALGEAPITPSATTNSVPLRPSTMLAAHNTVRNVHNLTPLRWSADLAAQAQHWSEVLQKEDCIMRHNLETLDGENIFWQKQQGGDLQNLISTENDAVTWWAAEEADYTYTTNSCAPNTVCGHYTQIIWANTTAIGCGVSSCVDTTARTDIWVCRYSPAGNIEGEKPY